MKKYLIFLVTVCLIVSLFSSISFASSSENPEVFKLGVLLPFTGTFSAVAETQKEGALQAVKEFNDKGGLSMPWGKVMIETNVKDDEATIEVGLRRYKYMLDEGVDAVVGQTWSPLAMAINEVCKKSSIPYFSTCVNAYETFEKGVLAECSFPVAGSSKSVGLAAGNTALNVLGAKTIYFLGRSDSWGDGIYDGFVEFIEGTDAEIVAYDRVPAGTQNFVSILQKVKAAKPDIFVFAQFAADCAAVLKQAGELGLKEETILLNVWMTNAVAVGIPQDVLEGVYANAYFYWDLTGFPDKKLVESVTAFSKRYEEVWDAPPDAYGVIAYDAVMGLFKAVEKAGSFGPKAISEAIMFHPTFETAKGLAYWRKDHQPVFQYYCFLLKGKAPEDKKGKWDFFDVVGSSGGEEVLPTLESLGY